MVVRVKWAIIVAVVFIVGLSVYSGIKRWTDRSNIEDEKERISEVVVSAIEEIDKKALDNYLEIKKLKEEIAKVRQTREDLEKEKSNIVVPSNIPDLVVAFNNRGFRARSRNMLPR